MDTMPPNTDTHHQPAPRIPRPRKPVEDFDLLDLLDVKTPEQRFQEFHDANPHVYDEIVRAARLFREQTGRDRCGMSLLFGRVRWVLAIQTTGDTFKLNNDYLPFYSRLVMERERDLAGMFATRRSVADQA